MVDRMSLFERLRKARGIFEWQDDRELEDFRRFGRSTAVVHNTVWVVNVDIVGDVNLDLRDDHSDRGDRSVTQGARVHGDLVVQGNLEQAIGAASRYEGDGGSRELARRLEDLHALVTHLVEHLPPESAQAASRDLESFSKEVTSRSPRRPFYEITSQGLIRAAKMVGHLALPIAEAVEAILLLLRH
jgi:hypothetical protein